MIVRPAVDLDHTLQAALDGTALLFTGAGFSFGATNAAGRSPLGSRRLAKALGDACAIDELVELDTAADCFQEEKGVDALISLLSAEYQISSVAPHHIALAAVPWIRTYTTNYDDVYEQASKAVPRTVQTIIPRMAPDEAVLSENDCVHVNGYIHDLTKTTIGRSFKLTRTSYLTETFAENPWAELFRTDLAVARAVIFIGYSLYDLDISRFIYPNEALRSKTLFIVSTSPSRLEVRNLHQFGAVFPIGVDGVAARLATIRKTYAPKSRSVPVLTSFDAAVVPNPFRELKDADAFALLMYGTLNTSLLWQSSQPGSVAPYTVNRTALVDIKNQVAAGTPNIVIHSDLGNGKSILIEQLRCWLTETHRNHFTLRGTSRRTIEELRTICRYFASPIIIVENYETRLDLLKELGRQRSDKTTLIITSRTSAHDVRFRDLAAIIGDFAEFDVNHLSGPDIAQFSTLLSTYGFWGEFADLNNALKIKLITADCGSEIRDVLLRILESPTIRDRLSTELSAVREFEDAYQILIGIFVLEYLAIPTDAQLLLDLFGPDTLLRVREFQSQLAAFLDVKSGEVRARSSILSEFVLRNIADGAVVLDTLITIAHAAAKRASGKLVRNTYRDILIAIVRFSNLQATLPERGRREAIIEFYESVKNLAHNRENAQFWLQYAVARVTLSNFSEAGQYFKTSYALASKIPGYDTSYIDNHYARYLLLRTLSEPNWNDPMEVFRGASKILRKQARETENRHYPFRVSSLFLDFFRSFRARLTEDNRQEIYTAADEILESAGNLPQRVQESASVRECIRKLGEVLRERPGAR